MTEQEKAKLDAVYDYCKREVEEADADLKVMGWAILTGFILAIAFAVTSFLLSTYAPEFWERIVRLLEWR